MHRGDERLYHAFSHQLRTELCGNLMAEARQVDGLVAVGDDHIAKRTAPRCDEQLDGGILGDIGQRFQGLPDIYGANGYGLRILWASQSHFTTPSSALECTLLAAVRRALR